jgi:5-methylcytosine-specific restriction protein A
MKTQRVAAVIERDGQLLIGQRSLKRRHAGLWEFPGGKLELGESHHRQSEAVKLYVLRRAKGACEACKQPAPFNTVKGSPYLEPHHTRRVADGGPDHPRWVAGICPNCHRRVHHGHDGSDYNRDLAEYLGSIEQS